MPQRQSPRKRAPAEPEFQPRRVNNPFRTTRRTASLDKLEQLISSYPPSPPMLRKLAPIRFSSPDYRKTYDYDTQDKPKRPSWERLYFTDRSENPYLHSTLLRASPERRTWSDPLVAVEDAWSSRPDASYRHYQSGLSHQVELKITKLDLLCLENATVHHTSKYDQIRKGNLVVRRGQRFDLYIQFNREINHIFDKIRFVFDTGTHPAYEKGTYAEFFLNYKDRVQWKANIVRKLSFNEYIIGVIAPPFCIASGWRVKIQNLTNQNGQLKTSTLEHAGPIYILFNPWCVDDNVYFPNSNLLDEYIENDSGAIFMGNYKQIGAKPWFFGQFEDGILECSLYCLHKAFNFKFGEAMGDPVLVSRAISRIINSQNDQGVLVGNWTSNFYGGTSPLQWTGSVAILREFMNTKMPVKFGQCFVFSALLTTICRSIGIPCRSVTNFASAHDTGGACKVDVYWDWENMTKLDATKESVWNFHAWNDVWMKRDSDLAPNFSGWQAIDASPQDQNGDMSQSGPASIVAIKTGNCELKHESRIFFAELNADRVNYSKKNGEKWNVQYIEREVIGKNVSTKIPDGKPCGTNLTDVETFRFDITAQYKYEDESLREKLAMLSETRAGINDKTGYTNQDIIFEGFMDMDNIMIGSDFEASGLLRNIGNRSRTVEGRIMCEAVSYMGHRINTIKQQGFRGIIDPDQECQITMDIEFADYGTKLSEQAAMKISLMARVIETGQTQAWQDDFRLRKPDLKVEVLSRNIISGEPFECRFSFKNPLLSTYLRNCTLTVDGAGLREGQKVLNIRDVSPGELWSGVSKLTFRKPGNKQLTATFNSLQIEDISGVAIIDVN